MFIIIASESTEGNIIRTSVNYLQLCQNYIHVSIYAVITVLIFGIWTIMVIYSLNLYKMQEVPILYEN